LILVGLGVGAGFGSVASSGLGVGAGFGSVASSGLGVGKGFGSVASIGEGEIINGTSLASNIKNGKSCVTIYSTLSNWKLGETLRTYNLDGDYFIRNDKNKVKSDNLGNLLELRVSDMGEEIPEAPSLEEKTKTRS